MKSSTKKWIRGGVEILIHGFCAAAIATLTACFIDSHDWAIGTKNFYHMFLASFVAQGGIRFLQWWMANPFPPDDETEVVNINPLKPTTSDKPQNI